jgi:hypothetical protein
MRTTGKIIALFALAFPVSCVFVAVAGLANGFFGSPLPAEIAECWIAGFAVSAFFLSRRWQRQGER